MLERRINLLVVTPRYPPLTGGVEHHVSEVARRLPAQGFDVTVLTTDMSGELRAAETLDGVKVRRVPAWPRGRDYRFAPGVYRGVADGDWDLMHLQSYHTAVAPTAMLAAVRGGVPFVVTFHGGGHSSRLRGLLRGPQRAALRPLLGRADRLVAVAAFEADFFSRELRIPPERFVVIPNGSDLPLPAEDAAARRGRAAPPVIASVGRLERYKGHQRVVDAMPRVIERVPGARLRVIGSGPYGDEIRGRAERLGVRDSVEVLSIPASERAAMATALTEATLVVLMSEFETHPLSVIEAISLGTPALVADTSGLRELAESGLASAVPLDMPPSALADAIVERLLDPRPVPKVALPRWDDCARELAALYRDVAVAGGRAPALAASAAREAR